MRGKKNEGGSGEKRQAQIFKVAGGRWAREKFEPLGHNVVWSSKKTHGYTEGLDENLDKNNSPGKRKN